MLLELFAWGLLSGGVLGMTFIVYYIIWNIIEEYRH